MGYLPKSMKSRGSITAAVMLGVVMSIFVTMIATVAVSAMIHREVLPETAVVYGVVVILLASSYVGAKTGCRKAKNKRLMVSTLSGLCYLLVLMTITAVLFEGKYNGIGVTGLIVLCGAAIAALPNRVHSRGGKRRKIKIPSR